MPNEKTGKPLDTKRAATRKDVAKLAGVSVATVSYVLNNDPKQISETTRERVLAASRKLNYKPNPAARSLKTGSRELIGLLLSDLENPPVARFLEQAQRRVDHYGYSLVIILIDEVGGNHQKDLAERIESKGLDGLILFPPFHMKHEVMRALAGVESPAVCIGFESTLPKVDAILPDLSRAGEIALEYLYAQGCADIWFVCGGGSIIHSEVFAESCQRFFDEKGSRDSGFKKFLYPQSSREMMTAAIEAELQKKGRPDGFLCGSSDEVETLYRIARRQGWTVPARRCVNLFPTETSARNGELPQIRYDWKGMGETAVDMLFQRMKEKDKEKQRVLFDVELVIR